MTNQPAKPGLAMPVADVATSTAFYIDYLGCTLAKQQPAPDIAHLIDPNGDSFLLVGPQAGDPTPFLNEQAYIAKPRETLGSKPTFGSIVDESMTHTLEHIDEILEIRRIHGV